MASDPYYSDDSVASSETEFSDEEDQDILSHSLFAPTSVRFSPGPQSRRQIPPGFQFTIEEYYKKSNEALGVWRRGGSVWKVYRQTTSMATTERDINTARAAQPRPLPLVPIVPIDASGRPVASGDVFTPINNRRSTYGYAIQSQFMGTPNIFFSAQVKNGRNGPANFRAALQAINNLAVLQSYRQGLEIAVSIELRDPQGFIDPTIGGHGIRFMDIHIGSATGSEVLLEIVEQRIAQL